MAKHELRADRRRKAPKATIQAAPTVYEITKPAGSAERFLDDAAKAALAAAAAGGLPSPKQFIPGAIRAVAKDAEKYPDPLLAEAAGLPREELLRRAANAEAYQKTMEAQNEAMRAASAALSPAGNMVANQVGAAAHDALTKQDAKGGDTRPAGKSEKNTLLSETARAAWADLTRTHPRDRTAEDLTPKQKAALAKAWSVEGDGIYHYNAYDAPQGGPNSNALSPGYWFNKDPNHQVEKLFGRGTASWTSDGDLVFNDTYDLDFGGKNLPGVPTNADPDEVKIRSRISARALGLDPKKLWETANARIQDRWSKLEPVMDKVYKDVQAGRYKGQVDPAIQEVQALQARYNRINSGPYKPETASTLAAWKHPEVRRLGEFDAHMDRMPAARISTRQDAKGGDAAGPETAVSETPVSEALQNPGGPRIVINPTTFHNRKDALCVAFNEGFRVWMEANDFQPQSEPTDAQRKFFSDTAYADDEVQLRRTILARIATFDTSVKDPTDDQLSETASFLGAVLESGWCKNEWERDSVSRLMNAVQSAVGAEPVEPRQEPLEAREAEPLQRRATMGGGETEDEEERRRKATQFAEERGMSTESFEDMDIQTVESVYKMHDEQFQGTAEPSPEAPAEQSENDHREAIVAANGAELDARAKEHVAAANRTIESLDQHIASAEALGKIVDNWNKSTDQILAQGEKILSGGNSPEQTQTEQPGRAVAQRGADGHFHDASGRIVSQRTAQAELDKAQTGQTQAGQAQTEQPGRAVAQRGADGHFHDASGRIVSQRTAQAELDNAQAEQPEQQTASQRIGVSSGVFGPGGRQLTAAEAAWRRRRRRSII